MDEREYENYELFRRAILLRDEQAWAAIHARFRPLLVAWAHRCCAKMQILDCCDDIADHALARAWVALTPARFMAFPTLAKLLAYLRACVTTTTIDCLRAQAVIERSQARLSGGAAASTEQIVLASMDRAKLWGMVLGLVASEAERVVLIETFAYGLSPRDILTRHPRLFVDIDAVYSARRNLFARLQRNREIVRLREEFLSA